MALPPKAHRGEGEGEERENFVLYLRDVLLSNTNAHLWKTMTTGGCVKVEVGNPDAVAAGLGEIVVTLPSGQRLAILLRRPAK